jgi:hypothetical protein
MRWSSRLLQLPRLMYAQLIARMGEFLRDAPRWCLRSLQVLFLYLRYWYNSAGTDAAHAHPLQQRVELRVVLRNCMLTYADVC